jgi:hypothetical protein
MATGGDGQQRIYRIIISEKIKKAIRKDYRQAVQAGRGQKYLASLRTIYDRLQNDPKNFGETLFRHPALKLIVLKAVVAPIAVIYGVHEDQPLVFVRTVLVLG